MSATPVGTWTLRYGEGAVTAVIAPRLAATTDSRSGFLKGSDAGDAKPRRWRVNMPDATFEEVEAVRRLRAKSIDGILPITFSAPSSLVQQVFIVPESFSAVQSGPDTYTLTVDLQEDL